MTNAVETLLEDDHQSLSKLLAELDGEMAKSNVSRAFELLDLFWARLAVHIRAENLHLFPAIAHASYSGGGDVPASDGLQPVSDDVGKILGQLRADHDFFMKELAEMIKVMRVIAGSQQSRLDDLEGLRQRLTLIKERLDRHNELEEQQVYGWPALLLDEQTTAGLCKSLQRELEDLPPRFA
ncbi:MAG TPA: hemerythrin domain-containing protein [Pyrinomonadaceae bacterium]|nr:hemerythrin domain-containing protein [Pyrinomonadaceae bacterium]